MIDKIAERLNKLAVEDAYDIAKLHEYRGVQTKKIFTKRTINVDEKWAFHDGGRKELQFNIGVETLSNGKEVFRFGVAISLEASRSLPDPLSELGYIRSRFNAYAMKNREVLASFKMWCSQDKNHPQKAGQIPFDWFQNGNFIFIGRYFSKPMENLKDADLHKVLETFDELLPVYVDVQFPEDVPVEDKISKVCWNYNGWRKPSGMAGKSKDPESHERMHGYGHEEWLFDFDKLVDGYHYAFLQPIGKYRDKYAGHLYNLSLYSVNTAERNQFYWVANIENAEVIDEEEEKRLIAEYESRGWLDEMYDDLIKVGADVKSFKSWVKRGSLFNVRFRPQDVHPFGPSPVPFRENEKISHTRYTLLNRGDMKPPENEDISKSDLDLSNGQRKNTDTVIRKPQLQSAIECSQLHAEIQNALVDYLRSQNPDAKYVGMEVRKSGCNTSIDVAMETKSKVTFFEVKTYASAKYCIREALGQLLEYSYYPVDQLADELVIVSQAPLEKSDRAYLENIRKRFSIPVAYWQYESSDSFVNADVN